MDRQTMYAKLQRNDISGIGVIAEYPDGSEVCYFYQDFTEHGEDNKGIIRAMKQLYPKHDKGIIKKLTFVEWGGVML